MARNFHDFGMSPSACVFLSEYLINIKSWADTSTWDIV